MSELVCRLQDDFQALCIADYAAVKQDEVAVFVAFGFSELSFGFGLCGIVQLNINSVFEPMDFLVRKSGRYVCYYALRLSADKVCLAVTELFQLCCTVQKKTIADYAKFLGTLGPQVRHIENKFRTLGFGNGVCTYAEKQWRTFNKKNVLFVYPCQSYNKGGKNKRKVIEQSLYD